MRLAPLWYQMVQKFGDASDCRDQALLKLLKVCANIGNLCYARVLLPVERAQLAASIRQLHAACDKLPGLRFIQGRPKLHQSLHFMETLSVYTGHLANVEAHERLNKVYQLTARCLRLVFCE